jgi:hypothetical protein
MVGGGTQTANFTNSSLESTGGPAINAAGQTANILLDASTVTGTVLTAAGSTSNVILQNDTTWSMTGNSNVTNLTNAASFIRFSEPEGSGFKTLMTDAVEKVENRTMPKISQMAIFGLPRRCDAL